MSKYTLKEPTQVTKERLLEIKFHLFATSFLYKAGKHTTFKTDILGIICNTYNINTSAMLSILNTLEHPQYKPTTQEIVIGSHLMGITVRTLTNQQLVSFGNYYKTLQEYIDNNEPSLQPKLTDTLREVLKSFFDCIEELFEYSTPVMKGTI